MMNYLQIFLLFVIFVIPRVGYSQDPQGGTILIPIAGGIAVFFIQSSEASAEARSQNTLKLNIGASMDSRIVELSNFVSRDLLLMVRHNQAFALSNNIVSQAQEIGSRYFIWSKIFLEGGLFHAVRREKAYLYFARDPGPGLVRVQHWTARYESYGNYAGLGAETQFRHFSIGLVALNYHSWRSWKKNGASISELPETQLEQLNNLNQECRDAYRSKLETSVLFGISF